MASAKSRVVLITSNFLSTNSEIKRKGRIVSVTAILVSGSKLERYLLAFEEELRKAKDTDGLISSMKEQFPSADLLVALERGAKANVKPRQTN